MVEDTAVAGDFDVAFLRDEIPALPLAHRLQNCRTPNFLNFFFLKFIIGVQTLWSHRFAVSAAAMRVALENLGSVARVDVAKTATGTGYEWAVAFLAELGDLKSLPVGS